MKNLFGLLIIALMSCGRLSAASEPDLALELRLIQVDDLIIRFEIINKSVSDIYFLQDWETGRGRLMSDIFDIQADGKKVTYFDVQTRMPPAPTLDDYTLLRSGGAYSAILNLRNDYSLRGTRNVTINLRPFFLNLFRGPMQRSSLAKKERMELKCPPLRIEVGAPKTP